MDSASIVTHINVHRARHCAPPLHWSDELAYHAQDGANREIVLPGSTSGSSRIFGHNIATRLSINLANPTAACLHAIDTWLGEQEQFYFENSGYSEATRNFAAIIARAMTHVGFGVGRNDGGYTVAAILGPRSSYLGNFGSNVSPTAASEPVSPYRNTFEPVPSRAVFIRGLPAPAQAAEQPSEGQSVLDFAISSSISQAQVLDISRIPSFVCVKESRVEVQQLLSENRRFRFVMQPDRCITLYMGEDSLWAIYIGAMGRPNQLEIHDPIRLFLQSDGNLVASDASGNQLWATDTANRAPAPYILAMQDDGDCVLYADGGVRLWATRTRGWT